ncbi:MAG: MarC family protein, partial [Nitrospirota bacterium]|nr:MarC family protein [Nitrospirota bacterium]
MTIVEYALFAFSSLFVIVDPIAVVPAFLAMTPRNSVAQRLRTSRMACVVAIGILTGFALFGQTIFKLLGITLPAVQIAGGLILL